MSGFYAPTRVVTANPAGPATNTEIFRSDRGLDFYYDGTRWLSKQVFGATMGVTDTGTTFPISATGGAYRGGNIWFGIYDVLVIHIATWYVITGVGNWSVAISAEGAGGAGTLALASHAGLTATGHQGAMTNTITNSVLAAASYPSFSAAPTENSGTATFYFLSTAAYRAIG